MGDGTESVGRRRGLHTTGARARDVLLAGLAAMAGVGGDIQRDRRGVAHAGTRVCRFSEVVSRWMLLLERATQLAPSGGQPFWLWPGTDHSKT